MVKQLPADKGNAQYLPWRTVNRILDKYCPGWEWEIKDMKVSRDRIFMIGRLGVCLAEKKFWSVENFLILTVPLLIIRH